MEKDFFAETAVYNDWYYGTAKKDYFINNAITVLTPHGLRQIKNKLPDINIVSFYINVPRRDRLIKILQRGDNIEESYRRNLSDVGQFDGIEDEVDYILFNPEYIKSIEEMAKETKRLYELKLNELKKSNQELKLNQWGGKY